MSEKDLTGIGELQALLGRGAEFSGKLTFQGRVRIDGTLRGEIVSEDVLILGPSADVEAEVRVGTLIVRGGTLRGPVRAQRLVEIYAPSKVVGDITTSQIFLDKGATFEGNCSMLEDATEAPPEVEQASSPGAPEASETAAEEPEDAGR